MTPPADPQSLVDRLVDTPDHGHPEPVDRSAAEGQQRGDQGDRTEHHHQDHDPRGHPQPEHERHAGDDQSENADHDGAACEHDRLAAGASRHGDGVLLPPVVPEHLPISGDDEERVVDADADPDHRAERQRQARHVHAGPEDVDHRETHAEAHDGREQRQPHRDHAAEGQQQDDDGGDEPEQLGRRRLLGIEEAERSPDLHHEAATGDRGHRVDEVGVGVTREVALTLVVADGDDGGRAIG